MKNALFIMFVVVLTTNAFAQAGNTKKLDSTKTDTELKGKNEVSLNFFTFTLDGVEITYERLLTKHTATGISLFVGTAELNEQFYVLPYYRYYFGKYATKGLFLEGSTGIITTIASVSKRNIPGQGYVVFAENKGTSLGLAAAVGYKFLNKRRFVGSVYLGAGKLLGKNAVDDYYHRVGLTLGRRF